MLVIDDEKNLKGKKVPCSDSSSGINIRLDLQDRFVKFDFAKITCSREITGNTGYSEFCAGKTLEEILDLSYDFVAQELCVDNDDEKKFILYLEWDALRAAIVQYLGIERKDIDNDRCRITAVEYDDKGIEIAQVILPPQELPKILPCGLADK